MVFGNLCKFCADFSKDELPELGEKSMLIWNVMNTRSIVSVIFLSYFSRFYIESTISRLGISTSSLNVHVDSASSITFLLHVD